MSIYDFLKPNKLAGAAIAVGLSLHPGASQAQQPTAPRGASAPSGTVQISNSDGSILGCATDGLGGFTVDPQGKILTWTQNLNSLGGSDGTVVFRAGKMVTGRDERMHPTLDDFGEGVKLDGHVIDVRVQGNALIGVRDITDTELGAKRRDMLPSLWRACQSTLAKLRH